MAASRSSPMTGDPCAEDRMEFRSLGGNKPKTEIIAIREPSEITVMVIGCTGRGKTTFCNFLFREERFKSGKKTGWRKAMSDVNKAEMSKLEDRVVGVNLTVIDTPGYLATQRRGKNSKSGKSTDADEMLTEFSRALVYAKNGVDAVLVTLRCAEPSSMEEEMLLEFLTELRIWKHCIVLFTHGDEVRGDKDDEGYLEFHKELKSSEYAEGCPVLSQFVENCERRFIVVESVAKVGDNKYYRSKLDELYAAVRTVRKNAESPFNHPLLEMAENSYKMVQMQKCLRAANDKEVQLEATIWEKDQVAMRLDSLKGAIENDPPNVDDDARAEQDAEDATAILLQYLSAPETTDADPIRFVSALRRLEGIKRRQKETMDKLDELLKGIKTEKKKKLPRADLERKIESVMTPEQENAPKDQPGEEEGRKRCNLL